MFDVVIVSDFRFPGGTGSAIAEEIKASRLAGYEVALVAVEAANLRFPFPVNPRIQSLVDGGYATLIPPGEPVSARLAQIHSPFAAGRLPLHGLRIRAERRMLIVHHPPFAADGTPYYDLARARLHAEEILDGEVVWAPVGPLVRAQFLGREAPSLLPFDWHNIVDLGHWACPRPPPRPERPIIGRHSRPDPRKWPATRDAILQVYPEDPRFRVRVLGGGPFLAQLLVPYPRNWEILPFGAIPPEDFLQQLDAFVYYHHPNWVEAFGCNIAEAMASGLPCVLPPHFQELFGDGAVYAEPAAAATTALALCADPHVYRRQSVAARDFVAERFSYEAHALRLSELIGPPARRVAPAPATTRAGPPQRILLLSSNGVGMGHLTRLLAIARRLPDTVQPVFVTMSQAIQVVEAMGYLVEYLPYHQYLQCDILAWNKHLRQELNELVAFYGARVVVFDGNSPFQGLIDVADDNPGAWFVWCRRGMWQAGKGNLFIERERHFDAVLEPRDLADAFDRGPTPQSRARARLVPPIRLLDEHEWLPRDLACAELGLSPDRPTILVQLGSGNNFSYETLRSLVLSRLRADGVQVVLAEWLMADRSVESLADVRILRSFPLSRYYRAFDASVSAVGYNSFHELVQAGLPSIFAPNESPQQDDQLARARFAERHGFGICVRTDEIYRLGPALDRLLDAGERAEMSARCLGFQHPNGAVEAARMISELAFIRRGEERVAAADLE